MPEAIHIPQSYLDTIEDAQLGSGTSYRGYHSTLRYPELTDDIAEIGIIMGQVDHSMIALIDALERFGMTMSATIDVSPFPIEQTGPEHPCPMEVDHATN